MLFNEKCILNVRENKPWKAKENYYYRDLVAVYINLKDTNNCQIIINDIVSTNIAAALIPDILNNLILFRKKKGCKNIYKTVVWVNSLHLIYKCFDKMNLIKQFNKTNKEEKLWILYNDEFEIRNFNTISNNGNLEMLGKSCGFKDGIEEVKIMKDFILTRMKQGLDSWSKLNYSFAYCANKIFFKELQNLKYSNSTSIPDLSTYKLIQNCNKAGILCYNKEYKNLIVNNIYSWDLSSAYPSQFVNQKMPIGQFYNIEPTIKNYRIAKENDWAFLMKIKTNKKIKNEIMDIDCKETKDGFYYVLNDWDVKCFELLKFNFNLEIIELRVCKKKEYLEESFRKKIIEYYNDKQNSKGINDEMYFERKTTLDAIWGKGLQDFKPETELDVKNRYFRNHNRYLLPQWSLWGSSATRYEIIKAMIEITKRNIDDFVACDTDGIKFRGEHNEYFEKRNKEIMAKNAAAGFPDCEIGTWKFEGCFENFIQFGYKQYAFSLNGELTCKFAGCGVDAWKSYFKDKSIEECFELLNSKDIIIPDAYRRYEWINNRLLVVSISYKPGDENLETYQVKAV